MFPPPNPQTQQPNRRPPQPMGQQPNQPGQLNQNGQGPPPQTSAFSTGAWRDQQQPEAPAPEAQPPMRYGGSAVDGALAQRQALSSYSGQNAAQPSESGMGAGTAGGSGMGPATSGGTIQPSAHPQAQPQGQSWAPADFSFAKPGGGGEAAWQSQQAEPAKQWAPADFSFAPKPSMPAPSSQPKPAQPQPAAQQGSMGPMAPPPPYQRQNMPQQSQANRRLSPGQA